MVLDAYLRNPLFLRTDADLETVKARLKSDEHSFVFRVKDDRFYPVNSISLFMNAGTQPVRLADLPTEPPVDVLPYHEIHAHVLDLLSQEVTLVRHDGEIQYFRREDYLLATIASGSEQDLAWLRTLFYSIPKGLVIVDPNYAVVNSNAEALRMLRMNEDDLYRGRMDEILGKRELLYVRSAQKPLPNQVITMLSQPTTIMVDFAPIIVDRAFNGFVLVLQDLPTVEGMAIELDSVKHLNQDLEAILSTIYDEIIVVSADGRLLRASEHYIETRWVQAPSMLIGEAIGDLKADDDILLRVIRDVQSQKQRVSLMQHDEYPVFCVGNPIFTEDAQLERIVIASRDLTELTRLQRELEKTRKQGESYRRQLELLQQGNRDASGARLVYASPQMDDVMAEVRKVAQFGITSLLIGESGVGKEVIADLVHSLSDRSKHPFIKINCAAIPESLLESELFGYEKGAFSGASQQGKKGLFIKAHKGTLFLDEISELPLGLQAKLLRALQDREVYSVGGTTPIKFDVHIVAASNVRLEQMVAAGKFRADLFYRINVYPIEIPPLRDRKADIGVLLNHYLFRFNQTYQRDLRFSSPAIDLLEGYEFPGNVRELQNIVQRAAIKTEGDIIDVEVMERMLQPGERRRPQEGERFQQVVPLRRALEQVEEELITLAVRRYNSTTQAARALGISQSSVSRKYRRIEQRRSMR